jgi:ADP-ribosylglycohydrolase/adenine/guanine phosphoribosyltransferase-like PRPP-binding protein
VNKISQRKIQKCIDMLLGIAIGDAWGGGYENMSRHAIGTIHNKMKRSFLTTYRKNRKTGLARGRYTDDAQMSLGVAELLSSGKEFNRLNLAGAFIDAFTRDRRAGYSTTTRSALEASLQPSDFLKNVNRCSTRNGSVMRTAPIGVLGEADKVVEYAIVNSRTTHDTEHARTATAAVSLASHFFFHQKGTPQQVFEFCLDNLAKYPEMDTGYLARVAHLDGFQPATLFGKEHSEYGVPVDAQKTAGAVLFILSRYGEDPKRALKEAVLLGGDTDTTGSLVLGISASGFGLDSIPEKLMAQLENERFGRDYLITTGIRLASLLPIDVAVIKRHAYAGSRKEMVVHSLDGLIEPVNHQYLRAIIGRLMDQSGYRPTDVIIGVDSTGYIPAISAGMLTGLPVHCTKKALLDYNDPLIWSRLAFEEPGTPHPDIFLYNLPRQQEVVLVDDEIMSGNTLSSLANTIRIYGGRVRCAIVPVECTSFGARERLEGIGVKLISHTKYSMEEVS